MNLTTVGQSHVQKVPFTNPNNGQKGLRYEYVFHSKDGFGKPDSVSVMIFDDVIDSLHLSDSIIRSMISKADDEARYSLKEPSTYEINHYEKFVMTYLNIPSLMKDSDIELEWNYIGQNIYGAKRPVIFFAIYDKEGHYLRKEYFDLKEKSLQGILQ